MVACRMNEDEILNNFILLPRVATEMLFLKF